MSVNNLSSRLRILRMTTFVLTLILLSAFSFTYPNDLYAQCSGNRGYPVHCVPGAGWGDCTADDSDYSPCYLSGGSCVADVKDQICGYNSGNVCDVVGSGADRTVSCTGGGGGPSTCPAECRRGPQCGAGYDGASGCSGCNAIQVCCRARSCSSEPPPPPPPAVLRVPPITILGTGATAPIVPYTERISGTMTFSVVSDPTVATILPLTDDPGYSVTATAARIGTTLYQACATDANYGTPVCDTDWITVENPPAWLQFRSVVTAGGIGAAVGNMRSRIPATCVMPGCNPNLIRSNPGDHPGVAVAGGTINTGLGQVSSTNRRAENAPYDGTVYDYDFHFNKITVPPNSIPNNPTYADINGTPTYRGYHIVQIPCTMPGTVSTGNFDHLTLRTILFIDCNLNITGPINVTDGRGSLTVVVRGDITVDPSVGGPADDTPDIEGLYHCEGTFHSGHTPDPVGQPEKQLHVRGSVACGGFDLQRDLPDNSSIPAEVFETGVDQSLLYPRFLNKRTIIWREVAP